MALYYLAIYNSLPLLLEEFESFSLWAVVERVLATCSDVGLCKSSIIQKFKIW